MSNFYTSENSSRKMRLFLFLAAILGVIALFTIVSAAEAGGNNNRKKNRVRELGVMNFAAPGECEDDIPETLRGNAYTEGFDFKFNGALEGCLYTYANPDSAGCSERADGNWNYYEEGNELFIGTFSDDGEIDGRTGTLTTRYWFEATFPTQTDCENFTNQIDGGCVHTFINGSGTGVFKGARGLYSVIDNVVDGVAIDFPYILDIRVRR